MKLFLLVLVLLLPSSAFAFQVTFTIPNGPALTRLGAVCDLLRLQQNDPTMTPHECARQFTILGARVFNAIESRRIADRLRAVKIRADKNDFDGDLPLPTPLPRASTPTPVATPTASPTPTPMATP